MVSILLLSFFLLGTIVGSFLNVVVIRYGIRTLNGRSKCFSCNKTLRWFELVPVFSFLIQKGRCRSCLSRLSLQYPLVELITGLVFAATFWHNVIFLSSGYSVIQLLVICLELLLWSLLISLSVYDFRHKIIPDALVYGSCLISLLLFCISYFPPERLESFSRAGIFHISSLFDFWSGFLFAAPFALIWFFSKGRAMGLGDAKLVLLFPWLLGFAQGLSALVLGFWIGAAVALGALLLKASTSFLPPNLYPTFRSRLKNLGLKTELPLGPFLVLGLFLVYVFGWDVTGLGMLLQASF